MNGEVAEWCRQGARLLWHELRDLYGHVSGRLDGGQFALAMIRVPDPPADPEEVLLFDRSGQCLSGSQPVPNELAIHVSIYQHRPDVGAVVHCHPLVATALSAAGQTVRAITHLSARFGDGVPVFPGDFVTSEALGEQLADTLGSGEAVLMRGHGVVTVARTVPEAVALALILERAAQQQVVASVLGGAEPMAAGLRNHPLHRLPTAWFWWRQLIWERTGRVPERPTWREAHLRGE